MKAQGPSPGRMQGGLDPHITPATAGETVEYLESRMGGSTAEPAQPVNLGRYRIVRQLGKGGFGYVYLAFDPDLNRQVAIKIPRGERFESASASESFLAEARRAATLSHPHLVAVYDVGRLADGNVYVVMEYVAGTKLSDTVGLPLADLARLIELLALVADAVHYAHKQGLVHRDLKPDNILIDQQGRPRVADFGLAVHEDEQKEHSGRRAGTAAYMSPEQLRGEVHRLDGRSDVWALGVILYQLLAGRLPFQAETLEELTDEVLHRAAKPPRQINDRVSAALENVCLKCLAKPVSDRYSTASDLAADLRSTLNPAARPRRNWLRSLQALAALVLVAAATGWALWSLRPVYEPEQFSFDPKSDRPAIQIAGQLELTTTKKPDIFAAIEEIAKVGWCSAPGVKLALVAAMDDVREPVRYSAVTETAKWFDVDSTHTYNDEMLRKLRLLAEGKDDRGRPFEPSERIRAAAGAVVQRFPKPPESVVPGGAGQPGLIPTRGSGGRTMRAVDSTPTNGPPKPVEAEPAPPSPTPPVAEDVDDLFAPEPAAKSPTNPK